MMPFSDIHISQGSVATCLKRGGIFKHEFVPNLLQSLIVKFFFENLIIIGEVMTKSLVSCFFDSRCTFEYLLLCHNMACWMLSSLASSICYKYFYCAMLCMLSICYGLVSVCLCLSQVRVLLKRLNVGSHKQHHTIAQGL